MSEADLYQWALAGQSIDAAEDRLKAAKAEVTAREAELELWKMRSGNMFDTIRARYGMKMGDYPDPRTRAIVRATSPKLEAVK